METMGSRVFQGNYQRLSEPVVVKAKSRTLGTWYPKGTEPVEHTSDLVDEIAHLKRQLAGREMPRTDLHDEIIDGKVVKVPGPRPVAKPASNVRASAKPAPPSAIRIGTASYSSQAFTPVPRVKK